MPSIHSDVWILLCGENIMFEATTIFLLSCKDKLEDKCLHSDAGSVDEM